MSTAQSALLAVLGLGSVGGLAYLLLSVGEERSHTATPLEGPRAPGERPRPASDPDVAVVRTAGLGPDATDGLGAAVEVVVVDGTGRPLSAAHVRLVGTGGQVVESEGGLYWEDPTPGAWRLEVQSEGLLPYARDVQVTGKSRERFSVVLRETVPVRGTLVDVFGAPVASMPVWFLRAGENHPAPGEKENGRLVTATDRLGAFRIDLPEGGTYRVSVGQTGEMLATSPPVDLHLGGPGEVDAVLPGKSRLEVVLEDPPESLAEGKVVFRVAVLRSPERRRKADGEPAEKVRTRRTRDEGPARKEGEGRGRRGRDQAGEVGEAGLEELGYAGDPGDPGAETPRPEQAPERAPNAAAPADRPWTELAVRPLGRDARVVFPDLPDGVDLRLAFLRKEDRHESVVPFTLFEGRASVARFLRPPKRDDAEIAAEPVGRFDPLVAIEQIDPAGPKVGFHWR